MEREALTRSHQCMTVENLLLEELLLRANSEVPEERVEEFVT